jgi:hypothetical protein
MGQFSWQQRNEKQFVKECRPMKERESSLMLCYAITEQELVRHSLAERSGLLQEAEHGFSGQGFHLFVHGLPCESELYEKVAHITQDFTYHTIKASYVLFVGYFTKLRLYGFHSIEGHHDRSLGKDLEGNRRGKTR